MFFYLKLNTETRRRPYVSSEDGKVEGIKFTITGNGKRNCHDRQNSTVDLDLLPGTYTVTEQPDDKYETQAAQTVTIVGGKTLQSPSTTPCGAAISRSPRLPKMGWSKV